MEQVPYFTKVIWNKKQKTKQKRKGKQRTETKKRKKAQGTGLSPQCRPSPLPTSSPTYCSPRASLSSTLRARTPASWPPSPPARQRPRPLVVDIGQALALPWPLPRALAHSPPLSSLAEQNARRTPCSDAATGDPAAFGPVHPLRRGRLLPLVAPAEAGRPCSAEPLPNASPTAVVRLCLRRLAAAPKLSWVFRDRCGELHFPLPPSFARFPSPCEAAVVCCSSCRHCRRTA
jgi:hypothetical protein